MVWINFLILLFIIIEINAKEITYEKKNITYINRRLKGDSNEGKKFPCESVNLHLMQNVFEAPLNFDSLQLEETLNLFINHVKGFMI